MTGHKAGRQAVIEHAMRWFERYLLGADTAQPAP